MKVKSMIPCVLFVLFFAACGLDTAQNTHSLRNITEILNEVISRELGYEPAFFEYRNGFSTMDRLDIYWTQSMNGSIVVVYEQETETYYAMEIRFDTIVDVDPITELGPGEIALRTRGDQMRGDAIFYNFEGTLVCNYQTGELVEYDVSLPYGETKLVGIFRSGDYYRFGECQAADNTITFTVEWLESDTGGGFLGTPGTEIYVREQSGYENPGNNYRLVVRFENTELNLTTDFIQQVQSLPNVINISLSDRDEAMFAGTEIVLETTQPVRCYLNRSGNLFDFEDFNIEIVG